LRLAGAKNFAVTSVFTHDFSSYFDDGFKGWILSLNKIWAKVHIPTPP
jgi:hypothetical protein